MWSLLLIKEVSICNRSRPLQKTTTNQNTIVESSPNKYMYKIPPNLRLRERCRGGVGSTVRSRDQGVFCEIVSPRNVRKYTHDVLSI